MRSAEEIARQYSGVDCASRGEVHCYTCLVEVARQAQREAIEAAAKAIDDLYTERGMVNADACVEIIRALLDSGEEGAL